MDLLGHLGKLLTPNLIGTYRSFEVTEIVGFHKDGPPTNFLSLLVAEPSLPSTMVRNPFINPTRIRLPGTKWEFGIAQSRVSLDHINTALGHLAATGEWKLGSAPLKVGKLTALAPQFVPADAYQPHPWNGILKNNFFGGSYVLELFDGEKADQGFLLQEPTLLSQLAEQVRKHVPIGLDGLSDRIGNILIQLPVTVAVTKFGGDKDDRFALETVWRPDLPVRPLRLSWEIYEDATIEDYVSTAVAPEPASIPVHSKRTGARYVVWDDQNSVILGASAQSAFIGGPFRVTSHVLDPKTREFDKPSAHGTIERVSLLLKDGPPPPPPQPMSNPRVHWRAERIFRDSLHSLRARKEFVQYKGKTGGGRNEALADIQWLMGAHGRNGVWLWDPYLHSSDVLDTLFMCPWPNSQLRALSDAKTPSPCKQGGKAQGETSIPPDKQTERPDSAKRPSWRQEQHDVLEASKGNCQGLTLEFRVRQGNAGWPFHDRFLIFPNSSGGTMAWSLGTSVNSLGKQHHILQKVADGELIREAFLDLWDSLDAPKYLVWKTS